MLETQTTFVIGAGAGVGYKMPTGNELREQISGALRFRFEMGRLSRGDWRLERAIREKSGQEIKEYFGAAAFIADEIGLARSIDDFIDAHRDDRFITYCGKIGIASCILQAERGSLLYSSQSHGQQSFDMGAVTASWMAELFRIIQVPAADVKNIFNNCTFVVFNYDRNLEHFFHTAIKRFYRLSDSEAVDIMRTMDVVHPYGTVGNLPWQSLGGNTESVPFGSDQDYIPVGKIAEKIQTYTETVSNIAEIDRIKQKIEGAKKIVFLGFAFHRQNMNLLKPSVDLQTTRVYSTAYQWPPTERELAESQISEFCGSTKALTRQVHLYDSDCDKLIKDYARAIQYA